MPINRRDVLKYSLAIAVSAQVRADERVAYPDLTMSQAAAAIRHGEMSAVDYASALIKQSDRWASLNAFISVDHDALLQSAEVADQRRAANAELGPLHGVPLVFKDNIATTALPTTAGTGALRNYRPRENAEVAQALFDAGALLFGKNNMHELAAGITTNNSIYGAARNPYDKKMIPGGSSGGTGAALAARIAPAGLGTDTGGSVRIPASLCGISGLRPTTGRYSGAGIVPFASGTAVAGPMARTVQDIALLDSIISGDSAKLPQLRLDSLRLGVPRDFFYDDIDPEVASIMDTTLDRLRSAGATLVESAVDGLDELLQLGRGGPAAGEAIAAYARFFETSGAGISTTEYLAGIGDPAIRARLSRQLLPTETTLTNSGPTAVEVRRRYAEVMHQHFSANALHAIVIPPTPLPARPVGQDDTVELNGRQVSTFRSYVRNAAIASAAGMPAVVIPAGVTSSGLPLGIEFDSPSGTDRKLLAIAAAMQEIIPALPAPDPG